MGKRNPVNMGSFNTIQITLKSTQALISLRSFPILILSLKNAFRSRLHSNYPVGYPPILEY
jgi:hypothetical protein